MIFTFVWAFDLESEEKYIQEISNIFESQWWEVFFIELEADVEKRLDRNKDSFRLSQKESKKNIAASEKNLLEDMEKHRLNSNLWEIWYKNYMRINNNYLSADEVAKQIQKEFQL